MSEPLTLKQYQWPTWYGGAVMSDTPPLINEKLRAIRKSIGGLKAKKEVGGPMFAVRKATDLMAKLRAAIDEHDCHVYVVAQDVTVQNAGDIPPDAKGRVLRSAVVTKTKVRICAPDGSFIEAVGSGGGGDADDKAGGKASTFSYKDALIKAFTLPDTEKVIDTDDEDEVGAIPAPSADFALLKESINNAPSREALKSMAADAKKLPLFEQRLVSDLIKKKLENLP